MSELSKKYNIMSQLIYSLQKKNENNVNESLVRVSMCDGKATFS